MIEFRGHMPGPFPKGHGGPEQDEPIGFLLGFVVGAEVIVGSQRVGRDVEIADPRAGSCGCVMVKSSGRFG